MGIFETYAKRLRQATKKNVAEVYTYDKIPNFLRVQIARIMVRTIGPWNSFRVGAQIWYNISAILEQEIETFPYETDNPAERFLDFIGKEQNIDNWLSAVEVGCLEISELGDDEYERMRDAAQRGPDALAEINTRFREHGLGYAFESGQIIRVDSQVVHAEIIKPALTLLSERGFEKANEDFHTAHKHYRSGETRDAIVAANRAFESALKAICEKKRWVYDKNARASDLIKVVRSRGLFGTYQEAALDTYIAMLKTGLPEIRNKSGGHGSAPSDPPVPDFLAGYVIDLTASNILLVGRAYQALK